MRILLAFLISISFFSLYSQESPVGISFINNDLGKALEEASRSGQIVFVDAYTTWCGPCKMMDKNVFSDPEVAALFNERFVNLKLDMEKGKDQRPLKNMRFVDTQVFYSYLPTALCCIVASDIFLRNN